ncbi:MAG: fused MFS/spermidine synthase [Bifidobacteriaceae bacterium]|jgi:spermidine synthase|nr:fused MFS/spermidine synthase [Bifidobacteriaceae bacterium]
MSRKPASRLVSRWPTGPVRIDTGLAEVRPVSGEAACAVLEVNGVPSSPIDMGRPTRLDFEYLQWMYEAVTAHVASDEPLRAIHLGGGACALPRALDATYPDARQLVVEIDAALTRLVREWFDVPRAPRLRLRVGEGATELAARRDNSADVIVRDAFAGKTVPPQLTAREFIVQAARVLAPGGLYLANCADSTTLDVARQEFATAASVFAHVSVIAEPSQFRGRRYGNAVIVGGGEEVAQTAESLARRLRTLPVPARIVSGAEATRWAGVARRAPTGGYLSDHPDL